MTRTISIVDVAPRDGLQMEPVVLEPAVRAELVHRLADAGVRRIEVTSFVNAGKVPQMAHPEEVVAAVEERPGVAYSALVLNERGYTRLAETPLAGVNFSFAITDSYNRRNQGQTVEESIAAATARRAQRARVGQARGGDVRGDASAARSKGGSSRPGCTRSRAGSWRRGPTSWYSPTPSVWRRPPGSRELVRELAASGTPIGVHLHNTRNTGFANAYAALEAGAGRIDACVGGIGGCPFAPRATGNIATEDLVYLLEEEGVETGIDLDALIGVATWLEEILGRQLEGQVYRAGGFPSPVG